MTFLDSNAGIPAKRRRYSFLSGCNRVNRGLHRLPFKKSQESGMDSPTQCFPIWHRARETPLEFLYSRGTREVPLRGTSFQTEYLSLSCREPFRAGKLAFHRNLMYFLE